MTLRDAMETVFAANPDVEVVTKHDDPHTIGIRPFASSKIGFYDLRTLDTEILRSLVSPVA